MLQAFIAKITWYAVVTQIIGFAGMAMNFISYQQNTNKKIVGFQIFGCAFFMVHFYMLGAYTAAALNILGVLRNFVFFCRPKPWASKKIWLFVFCVSYVIAGVLTYENITSMIPTLAMIAGSVALFLTIPKWTRRLGLVCSLGWMANNLITGSIPGFASEIFTTTSILIAMWKFDRRKVEKEA